MKGRPKTAELRLYQALSSLVETNEVSMFLSVPDGFCTGLILCPAMIQPSQWLKEVWGGKVEPELESVEALQAALNLNMGHYESEVRMLPPPASYAPVMPEDRTSGQALFK